jgi:hypothetical protein
MYRPKKTINLLLKSTSYIVKMGYSASTKCSFRNIERNSANVSGIHFYYE